MAIPKFEEDVQIISKIPNYPGSEGGLTPKEFRAKFDAAAVLIQNYLNNVMIPELDKTVDVQALINGILDNTLTAADKAAQAKAVGDSLMKKLSISGGTMTGALSVVPPTQNGHATNKDYVDGAIANTHLTAAVTLSASGWSGSGPYTQSVSIPGILATDQPHFGPVYSGNWEAEKEAFALVDDLDTAAGSVTFTCFEEKPGINLTVQLEVNR